MKKIVSYQWQKNYKQWLFGIGLLGGSTVWYFSSFGDALLFVTAVIVFWYAYETMQIRKINVQQKDLQLMPVVMFYIRERSGSKRPYLRNIGSNPAIEIQLLPTTFTEGKTKFRFVFRLLDGNNTLTPTEERGIGINLTLNGKSDNNPLQNWLAYYDPENLEDVKIHRAAGTISNEVETKRSIKVRFKDVTGQKYETIIQFSDNGIAVQKAPQRI